MTMMKMKKILMTCVPLVGAVVLFVGGPFGTPALDAQGRPDLESLHQRLLPVFELAGVVYTDADETNGRLVVGVMDRDIDGLVRARIRALGVSAPVDIVRTEPIVQLGVFIGVTAVTMVSTRPLFMRRLQSPTIPTKRNRSGGAEIPLVR